MFARIVALSSILVLGGCSSPLYLTSSTELSKSDRDRQDLTFIAPYFAEVKENRISIALTPGSAGKGSDPSAPAPPALAMSVIPIPKERAYLYLKTDAFFSDTANLGVSTSGFLSSSDTASAQQITAILTEIAQTAAAVHGLEVSRLDPAKVCAQLVAENLPIYATFSYPDASAAGGNSLWSASISGPVNDNTGKPIKDAKGGVQTFAATLSVDLELPLGTTYKSETLDEKGVDGLVAFYPTPAIASLSCKFGTTKPVPLAPPLVLNLYLESHVIRPQRDFLTNPQDTLTFSEGFLTGHKYSDQSPAKTIVDTITAPVRALLPSVSVTNTTQVQTGGGKPDQTTTTTTDTASPNKSP